MSNVTADLMPGQASRASGSRRRVQREQVESSRQRETLPVAGAPPVHTLAQLRKELPVEAEKLRRNLQKRARAKYLSQPLAVVLVEYSKKHGGGLEQAYRNTIYCNSEITEDAEGQLRAKRCKNRWCMVCNRIRTGIAMEKYSATLRGLRDPQFVTLTRPNVAAADLEGELDELMAVAGRVKDTLRKRGKPLNGLRKLECTANLTADSYHPHFHFIVEGRELAEMLVEEWLSRCPTAVPQAQDVRPAADPAELFKYFTKLATKLPNGKRGFVPPAMLDVIFSAMKGRRVWQPLGSVFNATRGGKDEERDLDEGYTGAPDPRGEPVLWEWEKDAADWVDHTTGTLLSGYEPSERVRELVATMSRTKEGQNGPKEPSGTRPKAVSGSTEGHRWAGHPATNPGADRGAGGAGLAGRCPPVRGKGWDDVLPDHGQPDERLGGRLNPWWPPERPIPEA